MSSPDQFREIISESMVRQVTEADRKDDLLSVSSPIDALGVACFGMRRVIDLLKAEADTDAEQEWIEGVAQDLTIADDILYQRVMAVGLNLEEQFPVTGLFKNRKYDLRLSTFWRRAIGAAGVPLSDDEITKARAERSYELED